MVYSPYIVVLHDSERTTLRKLASSTRAAHREVVRARIVVGSCGRHADCTDRPDGRSAGGHGPQVLAPVRHARNGRAAGPTPP